jgi:phage portal protein BeeE
MRRYNENYFENHTSAGLVIQSSNRPAKGIREAFERKFGEDHAGSDAAGKNLWIWGHDLKIDKLTATPQEASYLESLARLREEILAVFKCPPFVVGLLEHANWSNAREQQQYYYRNAIIPWNRLLLNALNSSLLLAPYTERGQDVRLEHDYSDIEALQPNRKEQMEISLNRSKKV